MRAFVDCEWDNAASGGHGQTISIGVFVPGVRLVELVDEQALSSARCPWVRANVSVYASETGWDGSRYALSLDPRSLSAALAGVTEIVADWPEDVARVCAAIVIPGAPPSVAPVPPVLRFVVDRRLSSADSATPHNAAADAVAIARSWEQIQ